MTELNGAEYRAKVRLSTKANETLAEVGGTCTRVPVVSLPALLASGKIERIATPMAPAVSLGSSGSSADVEGDFDGGR